MKPELRVLLFVTAVAVVFVTAGNFLVAALYRKLRKLPRRTDRAYVLTSRLFFSLAALGVLCVAYGFYEPYRPEVTFARVPTSKFAKGSSKVRVVHISDVHSDAKPRLETKLPAIIRSQKPDLIVFSGDAANRGDDTSQTFRTLMAELGKIAPVYAVRGNWDLRRNALEDLYGGTGAHVLEAEVIPREVNGQKLWIGGYPADFGPDIHELFTPAPKNEFRFLIHHYPDRAEGAADSNIDLMCAGHTHGGQVALPLYGALITMSRTDKRFEAGLYRVKNMWLYVNRGIGMEGFGPRVRFLSRPEITVIDIVPAE